MNECDILKLYFKRDEQAVSETEKLYGSYCFRIAKNVLGNDADAEEVVSDTLLQTWNSIPPNRPESLKLYLARISRNLSFSKWRSLSAQKRGGGQMLMALEELGDCVSNAPDGAEILDKKELGRCISQFLSGQSQRERSIFLRRYFYLEDTAALAKRFDLREANVHQILSRTRRRLKDHLIREGYDL